MKKQALTKQQSRRGATLAVTAALALLAGGAQAENHALIMTLGEYSNPRANLPGIDLDAQNAERIAQSMGVTAGQMTRRSNQDLTVDGIAGAFDELTAKIGRGDNVFIYYSGHGGQDDAGGGRCSQGMVSYDLQLYRENRMEATLTRLAEKAGKIVFLNDSCFSGGAAGLSDKSASTRDLATHVGKFWKAPGSAAETPGYVCGHPINKELTRNLIPMAKEKGSNLLYIAAAQDNEVAAATPRGSAATLAWVDCLVSSSDRDHSGVLTGEEVKSCAQRYLDAHNFNHHIALIGNAKLPVAFVSDNGPSYGGQNSAVAALGDIRNGASPDYQVSLQVVKPRLKIGVDSLDFSVSTNKGGYLNILQVGSDGQTFNRIFPNDEDTNNYIQPGTERLPHSSWMLKSFGPAGTSHLLAVVTERPLDLGKGMRPDGPFKTASGVAAGKTLMVQATGGNSRDPGRYGASDVVSVQEY